MTVGTKGIEKMKFEGFYKAADFINEAHAAGRVVMVDGREVKSWSKPAQVWGTGSLSVDVRAKRGDGIHVIWFKPGQTVSVIAGSAA